MLFCQELSAVAGRRVSKITNYRSDLRHDVSGSLASNYTALEFAEAGIRFEEAIWRISSLVWGVRR